MASQYVFNRPGGGTLTFDFTAEEISVSNDIDTLEVQDILDGAREAEADSLGLAFPAIVAGSGKDVLDATNGVKTGVTCELLGNWLVYSGKSSGVFRVLGGNLIQTGGGDPFKPNPAITYLNIQSAAATIVEIAGGAGFTSGDRADLATVKAAAELLEQLAKAREVHAKASGGSKGTIQKRDRDTDELLVEWEEAQSGQIVKNMDLVKPV